MHQAAYNDSGMAKFNDDSNNAYQSDNELINGVGAHEEVHLTDENIKHQAARDVYNTEKPAYEAEIKARNEWKNPTKSN
jgi:hypothetical protein